MPNTTNFNWTTPADTDLVKDGALAIRTLANGIDTSLVDLKGGTTGQVLSKATNTDLDFTWVAADDTNAIQNAIIDAKGDLIVGTAADTPARLAVGGTNGHVLTVDSAQSSGIKWAAIPSSSPTSETNTVGTYQTTTSTSYTDLATTGPAVTLTTGTKALVILSAYIAVDGGADAADMTYAVSGATTIAANDNVKLSSSPAIFRGSAVNLVTGLTAGSNTFTAKYRKQGGSGSGAFASREIIVIDLGS